MKKIKLETGIMHFINCPVPLPTGTGLHIISSGCGSGKTTMILEIVKEKWKNGILIVVPTINDAEELYGKIEVWKNGLTSFFRPKVKVIHSGKGRITEMEEYKKNPESISGFEILIITSVRLIIEPYELFLKFSGTGTRGLVLIDEMINFYPKPFDIPREMKDILSFVDKKKTHFGKSGKSIGGGYYKHCYHDLDSMRAAYSSSGFRLFSGRNGLNDYKTEYIMKHVLNNGLDTGILGKVKDFADQTCTILFDGTADCIFKDSDSRLIPISSSRYNSDIEFSQFDMTFKRKNNETWDMGQFENMAGTVLDMMTKITGSGKTLIVTWKTVDKFSGNRNNGVADSFETGDITMISYNFPKILEDCLVKRGCSKDDFSVIYRGSGQDRGCNEYRDYQNLIFLGEWRIPEDIVGEINRMFGCKAKFRDYMKSLIVQTICRLRIRKHEGLPIKVYFSSDINYNLMSDVQEYFKSNSDSSCKIDGILKPCPKYTISEKKMIFDLIQLYSYDSKIRDSIENGNSYSFNITLDELYKLIPKSRKAKDRYSGFINFLNSKNIKMTIV